MIDTKSLSKMAAALRILSADMVERANSGHPGLPLGMADVAAVLYSKYLRFDPETPDWPDRDRFVLSAGHGSALLYALSYFTGYKAMTQSELKQFRQLGSKTPGHPEHDLDIGVETTTGPLGQGFANAVGMALAEAHLSRKFGEDIIDHYTYVFASDGDLMEGISHEAASLAGHLRLEQLIVFYDDNKISIDGPTSLSFSEDTAARFQSYGWQVIRIDGHDYAQIAGAIEIARDSETPSLIVCETTIAKGAPTKAGTADSHGSPLGADEIAGLRKALEWTHDPFIIPDEILQMWRRTGTAGNVERRAWQDRMQAIPDERRKEIYNHLDCRLNRDDLDAVIASIITDAAKEQPNLATRKASGQVLRALIDVLPQLVGGSADLTPSNNTKVGDYQSLNHEHYEGRYIHYGVREHAMGAMMNGMALHGGVIPYAGTFLCFSDYMRPSMRLAALMRQKVVYVMTHDSIALGEDGPTHQPIEHLDALRMIPDLYVFRPADLIETAWAWQVALEDIDAPSVLALSRQSLPTVAGGYVAGGAGSLANPVRKGGYVLHEDKDATVTYIASGSEVSLVMSYAKENGIKARIVSMPCLDIFLQQDSAYQAKVLGQRPRHFVEASTALSYHRFCRDQQQDKVTGLSTFGASGKGAEVYQHLLGKHFMHSLYGLKHSDGVKIICKHC